MKIPMILLIAAVWAGYAHGTDKNPVPRWNHIAINILYGALLAGTAVFVPWM